MNFKSLGNESEGFKRKWLVEVCNIYPTHLLSYIPMLTDYDPADRRAVVKDFLDEFELLKLKKKLLNEIHVYHDEIRYGDNSVFGDYDAQAARDSYFESLPSRMKKQPQIILLDPDSGFYAILNEQRFVDVTRTTNRKQIAIQHIELLCKEMTEDSIIITYQYNNSDSYTEMIEADIIKYLKGKPINFILASNYMRKSPKIKFYFFTKQTT
jgi:hypothetical protein